MAREERVLNLCQDWMLEFVYQNVWQSFKTGTKIDQGILNLANGMLQAQEDRSPGSVRCKEVVFLMLTSFVMSMRNDVSDGAVDHCDEKDFADIARMVIDLNYFCNSKAVAEKCNEAYRKSCIQRLLACCHQNRYEDAKQRFEDDCGLFDKETCRRLQAILYANTKPHRFLAEYTLQDYLTTMTEFLEAVHGTLPEKPILMKVAECYINKGTEYKETESMCSSTEIADGIGNTDCTEEEEGTLNRKLQDIRKQMVNSAARSIRDHNNSNDFSADGADGAADGTPDDGTASGRKKRKLSKQSAEKGTSNGTSSAGSSDEQGSDWESDEDHYHSLHKRVPYQKRPFHLRKSLELKAQKLRQRSSHSIRMKWTQREEEEFYQAVQRFGVGEWQAIQKSLKTGRSNVQLKDKWRTICNTSYKDLCKKFGAVPMQK